MCVYIRDLHIVWLDSSSGEEGKEKKEFVSIAKSQNNIGHLFLVLSINLPPRVRDDIRELD